MYVCLTVRNWRAKLAYSKIAYSLKMQFKGCTLNFRANVDIVIFCIENHLIVPSSKQLYTSVLDSKFGLIVGLREIACTCDLSVQEKNRKWGVFLRNPSPHAWKVISYLIIIFKKYFCLIYGFTMFGYIDFIITRKIVSVEQISVLGRIANISQNLRRMSRKHHHTG